MAFFDLCNRENRQVMGVVICCSGRLGDIMSPTGAKRKLMTCASISELPCDIMSPTGAERKLMTCASISELPCDIMSPTGAERKLMTCASISELPYDII